MRPRFTSRRHLGAAVVVPAAMVASSLFVYQSSSAAFNAKTSNGVNSFSAGSVTLNLNTSASGTLSFTGLLPGVAQSQCVNLTYEGSSPATVRLYGGSGYTDNGVGQYLDLKVEENPGAGDANCSTFGLPVTTYPSSGTGTLKDFMTTRTSFATGVGAWPSASTHSQRGYRITVTAEDVPQTQNRTWTATFVWEAQNN